LQKREIFYYFCDEVFRLLEYNPADTLPTAASQYSNAISLGVMSKSFGLAGLRIGWIATRNERVYNNMACYKDYTSMCNSGPSELLAIIALKSWKQLVNRNLDIIRDNLESLDPFLKKWNKLFEWKRPIAGAIGFIKLKHPNLTGEQFCDLVVKHCQVLLLPSECYELDGHTIHKGFRIGFGRKNMKEALQILDNYLLEHFPDFTNTLIF